MHKRKQVGLALLISAARTMPAREVELIGGKRANGRAPQQIGQPKKPDDDRQQPTWQPSAEPIGENQLHRF